MSTQHEQMLSIFESLREDDLVEVKHEVKVGFNKWETTTVGSVVRCERRRHGLHRDRNFDDKAFSDIIVLRKDDGELTTVTLDEFTLLRKVSGS